MFFQCPHCSSLEEVDEALSPGDMFDCSSCGKPVEVPSNTDSSAGKIPDGFEVGSGGPVASGPGGGTGSGRGGGPGGSGGTGGRGPGRSTGPDGPGGGAGTGTPAGRSRGQSEEGSLSSQDRQHWESVRNAYKMIYFLATAWVVVGVANTFLQISFLTNLGIGLLSAGVGAVLGLLGYGVFLGSMACLIGAIVLFAGDAVLGLVLMSGENIGPSVGGFAARLVLLYPMAKGVRPLMNLQSDSWKHQKLTGDGGGVHHAAAAGYGLVILAVGGLFLAGKGILISNRFSPKEMAVSVTSPPGERKRTDDTRPTPNGEVKLVRYQWKTDKVLYELGVFTLPEQAAKKQSDQQLLNSFYRGTLAGGLRPTHQEDVTVDGNSGKEVEYRANRDDFSGQVRGLTRMFARGNQILMVAYVTKEDEYDEEKARTFLKTLRFEEQQP